MAVMHDKPVSLDMRTQIQDNSSDARASHVSAVLMLLL